MAFDFQGRVWKNYLFSYNSFKETMDHELILAMPQKNHGIVSIFLGVVFLDPQEFPLTKTESKTFF